MAVQMNLANCSAASIKEHTLLQLMSKHQKHLSFLNLAAETSFTFTALRTTTLLDLFKDSAQIVLTQQFVKDHRDVLQTVLFELQVQDKYKKWSIIKRLKDFQRLRNVLQSRYQSKVLQIPVESTEGLRESEQVQLLHFLTLFLSELSKEEAAQEHEFLTFLYAMSTHKNKEIKIYFQGYLSKRSWGRHNESGIKKLFNFLASWEKRYFTITREGVYFTDGSSSPDILDNLIFSSTFSFCCGASTGYEYGVLINSSHRTLQIDAEDVFTFAYFVHFLGRAIIENKNIQQNRFISFARVRGGCQSQFFVDGEGYFSALCDALLEAKREIFITGWMLSPYFSLKRPDHKEYYRLDVILAKVAKAGIKINIVIYNAPKVALNIDSEFSLRYLSSLSPNIKVLMHPNYLLIPFMWSHHEKLVIVDQSIAFMGGLDLGYGRFDTSAHLLTDPEGQMWPGVDYCNYRITDILAPQDYRSCSIARKKSPRMPWHDVGVRLVGPSVQDLSRHFIQYWNHVNFQLSMNDRELLMYVGLSDTEIENHKSHLESEVREDSPKKNLTRLRKAFRMNQPEEEEPAFDFLRCEQRPEENRKTISEAVSVREESQPKLSYSSSIFEMRASYLSNKEEMQFYAAHLQDVNKFEELLHNLNPKNIINHRYGTSFENVMLQEHASENPKPSKAMNHQSQQILRSQSMWSIGLEETETEHSILNAYLELIAASKEFIYIENQFFISTENAVTKYLCKRIIDAHKKKEKFRVIILLPALPGFEGHPADEKAAVFRVQVQLHLDNINYMYHKLRRIPNIDNYLYFFSLRTHALLEERPVTEIIYIHSKLMIVDDRVVLIGSANINDRSLLGSRDTELAAVIEDEKKVELQTKQGWRMVSKSAHELRKKLYVEHFGLGEEEAGDYFDDDVWFSMIEISRKNHFIYRELFGCYPDDEMTRFGHIEEAQREAQPQKYAILSPLIKSHAIPFQRHFLKEEDLSLKPNQKQYFIPSISFT